MSTSIDTDALRKAIKQFRFQASPSNGTHSDPSTIRDVHNVIDEVAKLMTTFVNEIEQSQ